MEDITVKELKERQGKNEELNIIDVREPHEYEEVNMGVPLIPLGSLQSRISEIEHLKDEELIVHCRSGARSANAKAYLSSQGFSKVRNLLGGIMEYSRS